MRRDGRGNLIYSPSDLVCFTASPFASWMERYHFDNPGTLTPDALSGDQRLVIEEGDRHELSVLTALRASNPGLAEVDTRDPATAARQTRQALADRAPVIYQAALSCGPFSGYADFVTLTQSGEYRVWDSKLARSPKPTFVVQLCCYTKMLAQVTGCPLAETFGVVLGDMRRVVFQTEDFIYYYRNLKARFLAMQRAFDGNFEHCPAPRPEADHGHWSSHAERFFCNSDHLAQLAGIRTGQIKKLNNAGITTLTELSRAAGARVSKLASATLETLVVQARLQVTTRSARAEDPAAPPCYELWPQDSGRGGENPVTLPADHPADVFFDIEGYPHVPGGLEYLFGAALRGDTPGSTFLDWWAHDRDEEKLAFEAFIDWVYRRWQQHPGMHIYHYAAYEVSALRRLSIRHDTRQTETDALLRSEVFVDLYRVVRCHLCIGEDSYSIKRVEALYRARRTTGIGTALDSVVQYACWCESGEPRVWADSPTLKSIRDYNEDDCRSLAELLAWLRQHLPAAGAVGVATAPAEAADETALVGAPDEASANRDDDTVTQLRALEDATAHLLADLVGFHSREAKPVFWQMYDRAGATTDELYDDNGCIADIVAASEIKDEAPKSLVRWYRFDPAQACNLTAASKPKVMFTDHLDVKLTLEQLDLVAGRLKLRCGGGRDKISSALDALALERGSLIPYEYVDAKSIASALGEVANAYLQGEMHPATVALLQRRPPGVPLQQPGESTLQAALRVTKQLKGECLVVQGPPGTGKTYTASRVIAALLAQNKRVGVASNSHKGVINLLSACGEAADEAGFALRGVKAGGDRDEAVFQDCPGLVYKSDSGKAVTAYRGGVLGGTAWLFSRRDLIGQLDYLFIDEAGQVPLANAVAMTRCAENLVLLGDQMQLEQPAKGSHPGDAGLSVLQYALLDEVKSEPDAPVFHPVVPETHGLFLAESRRMHPAVCRFISESIYQGRLTAHLDCARQRIQPRTADTGLVGQPHGIVFSPVTHDGNCQQSDEEVARVVAVYEALVGCAYTDKQGVTRPLDLGDFLFIAPYNAQVRTLQRALPAGARVASVDKFQGQEAPVAVLSLCSSAGEYGSRGLAFILDRNRLNVAVSRAKCLAVVVADPRIAATPAASVEEMRLLNLFCKLVWVGSQTDVLQVAMPV